MSRRQPDNSRRFQVRKPAPLWYFTMECLYTTVPAFVTHTFTLRLRPPHTTTTTVSVADKSITCRDCGQPFVFSASEQTFFAERGFTDPVRCLACRRALKARKAEATGGAPRPRDPQPANQEYSSAGRSDRGSYSGPAAAPDRPQFGPDAAPRGSRPRANAAPEYRDAGQYWDADGPDRRAPKPKRLPRWIEAEPDPEDAY